MLCVLRVLCNGRALRALLQPCFGPSEDVDHAPVVASVGRRHLHDPHRGSFFSDGGKKKRDRSFPKESREVHGRMGVDGTDPTCSGNKVETYGIEKSNPCIDVSRAFHPRAFVRPIIKNLCETRSAYA